MSLDKIEARDAAAAAAAALPANGPLRVTLAVGSASARKPGAHVMVDLETMGTTPGSVIASIGAIVFDPYTGDLGAEFYAAIDQASCEAVGLVADPDTVAWWSEQSAEARDALTIGARPLADVLGEFAAWWNDVAPEGGRLWCQGPSFDLALLDAACRAIGLKTPWKYNAGRDTRTIYEIADVLPDLASGTHHNALDDARRQAITIADGFRRLGLLSPARLDADDVSEATSQRVHERLLAWLDGMVGDEATLDTMSTVYAGALAGLLEFIWARKPPGSAPEDLIAMIAQAAASFAYRMAEQDEAEAAA